MKSLVRTCLIVIWGGVFIVQSSINKGTEFHRAEQEVLFLPSGQFIKKISLGYSGLLADIYWMRAVQYYGGKRLRGESQFPLLEPLINIATALDPQLLHAYRFGSVFLSEREPIGAGQPDRAIALLRKGIENNPDEWQLHRDVGFIYYWFVGDYKKAAAAFLEGSKNPKSAVWMKTFAAQLLAQGGSREAARFLWQEVYQTSENQRMKENAREHLSKLVAEDHIEMLEALIKKIEAKSGRKVESIDELVALVRLGAHGPADRVSRVGGGRQGPDRLEGPGDHAGQADDRLARVAAGAVEVGEAVLARDVREALLQQEGRSSSRRDAIAAAIAVIEMVQVVEGGVGVVTRGVREAALGTGGAHLEDALEGQAGDVVVVRVVADPQDVLRVGLGERPVVSEMPLRRFGPGARREKRREGRSQEPGCAPSRRAALPCGPFSGRRQCRRPPGAGCPRASCRSGDPCRRAR